MVQNVSIDVSHDRRSAKNLDDDQHNGKKGYGTSKEWKNGRLLVRGKHSFIEISISGGFRFVFLQ
jgi:hypothetical protein